MQGRVPYTEDDDEAIIAYLKMNKAKESGPGSTKGNALWRQLQKEQITCHSWQSMKSRYTEKLIYKIQSMAAVKMVPFGNDVVLVASQGDTKRDTTSSRFDSKRHCSKTKLMTTKRPIYSPASEMEHLSPNIPSKKSKYFQQDANAGKDCSSEIPTEVNHNVTYLKDQNDVSNGIDGEDNNCNVLKKVIDHKIQLSSSLEKSQVTEANLEATSGVPPSSFSSVTQLSDSVDMSDVDDSFDDFLIQAAISSKSNEKELNIQHERHGTQSTLKERRPFTLEEFAAKKEKFRRFLQRVDDIIAKRKR